MAAIQHIQKRDGIYQYGRRVPNEVKRHRDAWTRLFGGKEMYRVSLGTRDQSTALLKAIDAEESFTHLVREALGSASKRMAAAILLKRMPTADDIAAVAKEVRDKRMLPTARSVAIADVDSSAADWLDRLAEWRNESREERNAAIYDVRYVEADDGPTSPRGWASEINRERFGLDETSREFGLLISAVREGMIQAEEDIDALLSGKMLPPAATSTLIRRAENANKALAMASPTISVATETYLQAGGRNGPFPNKTVQSVKRSLREFIELVGDRRLHEITPTDVKAYAGALAQRTVGGRSEGSIERHLSQQTIQKALTSIRAAIELAIDRDEFSGPNPASGIKLGRIAKASDPVKMPSKRPFENGELIALLSHPWFAGCASPDRTYEAGSYRLNDVRFWAPIVALLSGMRAAELGGMRIAEVKFDDPFPHIIVQPNSYRRTKSGKARKVPLLDALLTLGFRQYVEARAAEGADRVFPDWDPPKRFSGEVRGRDDRWAAAKWIRAFNRTVIPSALGELLTPGTRQAVTFHSLRGTFKRLMTVHRVPNQFADQVIGHAPDDLDKRYVGEIPLEETYPLLRGLTFRSVPIDHLVR